MNTVVVTLSDSKDFDRAKRTINDVRTRGKWDGEIVYLTVDFDAPKNFLDFFEVTPRRISRVDTSHIESQYERYPLSVPDRRHLNKTIQWSKLRVFDHFFFQWKKVIFFDAGLRVLDKISYLDELDCEGKILAPDDAAPYDNEKRFRLMLELDANPEARASFNAEFSPDILNERYFLNCLWVYDTKILNTCDSSHLVEAMNRYPICRCNEMSIMNLLFTMKHRLWVPLPEWASDGKKRLFGWTEHDRDYGNDKTWRDFCFLKYPFTINFNCD